MSGDAFAEGGASAPPGCHPGSVAGGWVVSPASPDYPLFQAAAEALSILALRAAARHTGDRATWKELRGRPKSVPRVRLQDACGHARRCGAQASASDPCAETGAQSSRDLRMVRDALAVLERLRMDRRRRSDAGGIGGREFVSH